MGTAEIAERLGVSRQWAEILTRRRDFPEPAAILKAGRIWRAEDIEQWATEHRPRPESDEPCSCRRPCDDAEPTRPPSPPAR